MAEAGMVIVFISSLLGKVLLIFWGGCMCGKWNSLCCLPELLDEPLFELVKAVFDCCVGRRLRFDV